MMRLFPWMALGLMLTACGEPDDPCQDYIDRVCDCGGDCEEIKRQLDSPDADTKDQCEIELKNLGDDCPSDTDSSF